MRECDKQEKRVCKGLGAKRQIGSGATPFLKGDGVLDDLVIECKTKDKPSKSMSIQKLWFDKVKEEAFAMGKEGSIVVFSFGDGKDYVAESYDVFVEHYKAYRKLLEIANIVDEENYKSGLRGLEGALKDIQEIINK